MTSRYPPVALPETPFADAVQRFCLGLPEAWEDYPWGDIVYRLGAKLFAITGPGLPVRVTVKATPEDQSVLVQLPHIEVAPYIGRHGWVMVTIEDEATLDHARELIAASYELVRGNRRSARLKP